MKIPVAEPIIAKNAKNYLLQCLHSTRVSGSGPFVPRFEKSFAKYIGVKCAAATNSGTSSLHLALVASGVKPGDEVILPALTMIATALPIIYIGAKPVLVDSEKQTGNIDVSQIEEKITKKTRAIMPVDLHGHPVDMEPIIKLAKKYHLTIIEDAAEAHGAEYKLNNRWYKVGCLSDIACFSFYGNKIITTGEGGMVMTHNKNLAKKMRSLRNLARSPQRHFLHLGVGFAYRMSNLQAALGLAQLEEVNFFVRRKRETAALYNKFLKDIPYLELPTEKPYAKSVFWQYGILIKKNSPKTPNQLASFLQKCGLETRPFFVPLHQQPALKKLGLFKKEKYPVAEDLSRYGLCLPSGVAIKEKEILFVSQVIHNALEGSHE